MEDNSLPKCYNCSKDISEGFERCPHCGVAIRYTNIDAVKQATSLHTEGNLRAARGDFEGAIELYRQAVALFPDYAVAYYNMGVACSSAKRHEEAAEAYSEAIRLKPDFAAAYTGRGDSRVALERAEEAVGDYSKAIELYPDYARAYYKRALAHIMLGRTDLAREDLESYMNYKPHDAAARRKLESLRQGGAS
jgi:tetratricopeptide (TPR) repeat protein